LLTQVHVVREARAAAGVLFEALRLTPPVALALAWACSPEAATRANLLRYARDLAHVKLRITGADLAALGVRPGPVYGRALRAVLQARLDGLLASREAELELATDVLRREGAWPAT
jgi:tRNA nucleotidyltransferase (CCA-adding enzyme)